MQPDAALSVDPEVLCYVGCANRPQQIGLATAGGLVRYDFRNNTWVWEAHVGASMLPAAAKNHVIHVWESYVIKQIQKAGDAAKP